MGGNNLLKIFKHLKKQEWAFVLLSIVFVVAQVWLDLKLPDYMSKITLLVQTKGSQMSEILIYGAYMLFCALGSMASSIVVGFFAAKLAATLSMRLRGKVFNKVLSFSMEEINNFLTASLITRSTNDITQIQMFVSMGLQAIVKAPILAIWAIVKISGKNLEWTLSTGGAVLVLLLIISIVVAFAVPKFKAIQILTDNLNKVARENLTGLRVIRAYNAEKYQEKKFDAASASLMRNNLFANRITAIIFPGIGFIMSTLTLSIYWIGAYLINAASMPQKLTLFSDMVVFSSYSMQVIMAFMMLSMIFLILPRASVSAKRINEVINTEAKIIDGKINSNTQSLKGEVEFKNVSFKYPDAKDYILKNISFKAQKGETVAIIGSTGSGKSTLINLIPRFYDATEGEILVDGINVKDYTQQALHNKIGYVSQKAIIFSGTINSNVAYGDNGVKPPTNETIKNAVKIAQGTEFVEKMSGEYEASIAQGGNNISGGQKQRLSIARAICRNPEIYIFDDSFSALDYKTDKLLRHALKDEIKSGATSIIVAQRIGTIKDADKIIVVDNGEIVGIGTHGELLKACSIYKEIAYSQLSKEELESE